MSVSDTGDGLAIIIQCESRLAHRWMSFALWRSIYLKLPDAKVCVATKRGHPIPSFLWPDRFKVPFFYYTKSPKSIALKRGIFTTEQILELPSDCLAIRTYQKNRIGPLPVTSEESSTFVQYGNKCGKFVLSDWIDNMGRPPFDKATRMFFEENMTINELKVLSFWETLPDIYGTVC